MSAQHRYHQHLNARLDDIIGSLDAYYPAPENAEYVALSLAQARQSHRFTTRALTHLDALLHSLTH